MKKVKKVITLLALNTTLAASSAANAMEYKNSYYEDEGDLLFKLKAQYINTDSKLTKLPTATNAGADLPKSLTKNGYGAEGSMTYFFTKNIAAELSVGVQQHRINSSSLTDIHKAFGTGVAEIGKHKEIYQIPATATIQYHIAPFGGVRPYVGAGYNATYMHSRSKEVKLNNAHGAVLQAGVDFVMRNDMIVTVDVKQLFLKSKISFKKEYLNTTSNVDSTVKWNPLVISAGVGFKL